MKFKVGDQVRIVGNLDDIDRGNGWKVGDEFIISSISGGNGWDVICWQKEGVGIFGRCLELVGETTLSIKALEAMNNMMKASDTMATNWNEATITPGSTYSDVNGWYDYMYLPAFKSMCGQPKNNKTIMNTITSSIRRIFSPSLQKQYKAGLINNCGELTMSGEAELKSLSRDFFDKQFTARAEEIVKEAKE